MKRATLIVTVVSMVLTVSSAALADNFFNKPGVMPEYEDMFFAQKYCEIMSDYYGDGPEKDTTIAAAYYEEMLQIKNRQIAFHTSQTGIWYKKVYGYSWAYQKAARIQKSNHAIAVAILVNESIK